MATYEHSIILVGPHSEEKADELIVSQLVKMARPNGDNGKPEDTSTKNILPKGG
jgi:hypothetical protein